VIVGLHEVPDVVAVVPTLGGALPRLQACLDSVLASDFVGRLAVVVVWNDPRRPVPDLDRVTVLEPGLNLGFPGGLAHARSCLRAEHLWVLQDDVVVASDCLDRLFRRLAADDTVGVVSPVTVGADGLVPARSRAGLLDADGTMASWFPTEDTAPEDLDVTRSLDWVASSGSLARLSAWDAVGGFDPAFFPLLWSDVDFCTRLGRAGFRSVLEPTARIEHAVNASTPSVMGLYLATAAPERFRRKNFSDEGAPGEPTADPRLVSRIAQAASLGFVDLGTFASKLLRDRERDLAALRSEVAERDRALAEERAGREAELDRIRATWSWRLTAPMRRIRRIATR
jgi:GT2 family glycosyltransferase